MTLILIMKTDHFDFLYLLSDCLKFVYFYSEGQPSCLVEIEDFRLRTLLSAVWKPRQSL